MGDFLGDLKQRFKRADVLMQFIYINVGVFILVVSFILTSELFNLNTGKFLVHLELPSSFHLFIRHPWTLFSYMFLHLDFLHIFVNMLCLYWFGRIFLTMFNGRQLGGLYVLGGIGGGLFYILAFSILAYFNKSSNLHLLLGASASVLAIVVAPAISSPNYPVRLFKLGSIKLKYITIISVFLYTCYIWETPENVGGHVAHLGGALVGLLFALRLSKGKDITLFINKGIDKCWNLFESKPRMKVSYSHSKNKKQQPTSTTSKATKQKEEEELNRILDKLKKSGYESLSPDEKKNLFNASMSK